MCVKWLDAVKVVLIRLEPTGEKGEPGQENVHQCVTSSSWSMGTVSGSTIHGGHSLITPRYRGQRKGVHWYWA